MNILETKDLTKQFGGLIANNKISMHCKEGEILGLIGPNGAGKTTFLNAIAGLSGPSSGKVYFMGEDCTGYPPQRMCRRGLSRTFSDPPAVSKNDGYTKCYGVSGFRPQEAIQ